MDTKSTNIGQIMTNPIYETGFVSMQLKIEIDCSTETFNPDPISSNNLPYIIPTGKSTRSFTI